MIVFSVKNLTLVAIPEYEFPSIYSYLRFTRYAAEKFATTGYSARHLNFLTHIGVKMGTYHNVGVASAAQNHSNGWLRQNPTLVGIESVIPTGESSSWTVLCLSMDFIAEMRCCTVDWRRVTQRLQTRLSKHTFPPSDSFIEFMRALQGAVRTTLSPHIPSHSRLVNFPWAPMFPAFFAAVPDLSGWNTQVDKVLNLFATDRHTTVEKIRLLLRIKS